MKCICVLSYYVPAMIGWVRILLQMQVRSLGVFLDLICSAFSHVQLIVQMQCLLDKGSSY